MTKTLLRAEPTKLVSLLNNGDFERAWQLWESLRPTRDPFLKILGAEIELYFARLTEAQAELSDIDDVSLDLVSGARLARVRGMIHYWHFEYEQAENYLQTAYHVYRFLLRDEYETAVTLCDLGRLRRRQGRLPEAEQALADARRFLPASEGNRATLFLQGIITFNLAMCRHQQGDLDVAHTLYQEAIDLLQRTERLRNYAQALSSYGALLNHFGEYTQAVGVFVRARQIFDRFGIFDDLAHTTNNLARAMLCLGRYKEAESLVREAFELRQRVSDLSGAAACMEVLSELYLAKGELEKAYDAAVKALSYAEAVQNAFERAHAHIALGRVALRRRDFWRAQRYLTEALTAAEKMNNKRLEAKAKVYLTELYFQTSPAKGWQFAEQAKALLQEYGEKLLRDEFHRICQRAQTAPIRINENNELVISGTFIPNWYAAKEALERFLIKNALEQTGNNLTKAGKLLGVTKVHIYHKRREFET
ncbi:MAG TPA: tetratricopeptide repeat protein [Blastocatellia bacterium]|nr:tetratricopeptide repeat protein [Blastocatellia bacterium]